MSSTEARKRLAREYRKLLQDAPEGVSAEPDGDNIMRWRAVIIGGQETMWEGATFNLRLDFSEEYPNKPPKVRFVTEIFHPNVYDEDNNRGEICLDILQTKWTPLYDVGAVLVAIQSLLVDANPDSPANSEAAQMFVQDKYAYLRRVRRCVERSWHAHRWRDQAVADAFALAAGPRVDGRLTPGVARLVSGDAAAAEVLRLGVDGLRALLLGTDAAHGGEPGPLRHIAAIPPSSGLHRHAPRRAPSPGGRGGAAGGGWARQARGGLACGARLDKAPPRGRL